MKSALKSSLCCAILLLAVTTQARSAVTVTVDPGAAWLGYVNVFDLPSAGGAYRFSSSWGTSDLCANFSGGILTLSPNSVGDTDPYWYQGGGAPGNPGNKIVDASFYQETTGVYTGQTLTFTGNILSNTFTSAHTVRAFIKDFAPDYSSSVTTEVPLVNGVFSVTANLLNDPGRHVQFGFETVGVNVWVTDTAPFGNMQIAAVPEPSGALLGSLGAAVLVFRRRKK